MSHARAHACSSGRVPSLSALRLLLSELRRPRAAEPRAQLLDLDSNLQLHMSGTCMNDMKSTMPVARSRARVIGDIESRRSTHITFFAVSYSITTKGSQDNRIFRSPKMRRKRESRYAYSKLPHVLNFH